MKRHKIPIEYEKIASGDTIKDTDCVFYHHTGSISPQSGWANHIVAGNGLWGYTFIRLKEKEKQRQKELKEQQKKEEEW